MYFQILTMEMATMAQFTSTTQRGGIGNSYEFQEFIDRSEIRLKQHVPDSSHRHDGGDIWEIDCRTENGDSFQLIV